jgi:hypothetical protein
LYVHEVVQKVFICGSQMAHVPFEKTKKSIFGGLGCQKALFRQPLGKSEPFI